MNVKRLNDTPVERGLEEMIINNTRSKNVLVGRSIHYEFCHALLVIFLVVLVSCVAITLLTTGVLILSGWSYVKIITVIGVAPLTVWLNIVLSAAICSIITATLNLCTCGDIIEREM